MSKLSVIMPVHDGVSAAELGEAIASVSGQTFTDFELLIYTDGMRKPELLAALDAAAAGEPRIRIFHGAENRGIAFGLNRLIEQAQGEYIARMDADDVSLPTRFARQIEFLEARPQLSLAGTFCYEFDHTGEVVNKKSMPVDCAAVRRFMSRRDPFIHPTIMFRRSFFDRVGLYNESGNYSYLEDTELWSRALADGCETANLPEYLFSYRMNTSFYNRRRGWVFVWNEMKLRARYILKVRLPLYHLVFPLTVGLVRLCPEFVSRQIYKRGRV